VGSVANRTKQSTQALFHTLGLELVRYHKLKFLAAKRMEILRTHMIDLVLDVGANVGQYAEALRAEGFRGRIVSFEPTSDAFISLERKTARDEGWLCERMALSDADGERPINLSANSWSSSFLALASQHLKSAPESRYIGSELVMTSRLDSVFPRLVLRDDERTFLKLDVQGDELSVLRGGELTLARVNALECEVSIVALYEGQPLIGEMLEYLSRQAFELVALEPGFSDQRTGQLLQLEALFVRRVDAS